MPHDPDVLIIGAGAAGLAAAKKLSDAATSALLASHVFDWQSDRFSRGAYSYVLVNGGSAVRELAEPVENVLFFAGEAAHEGMSGTVAGALASGSDAAERILRFS